MLPPIVHAYADSAGTPAMLEAELEASRIAFKEVHPRRCATRHVAFSTLQAISQALGCQHFDPGSLTAQPPHKQG